MTTRTLYVRVLIETAAQAEALPIGTVVVHYPRQGMEDQVGVRVRGGWEFTGTNPDTFDHREAVGMEALVPVEAEEERKGFPLHPRPDDAPWPPYSNPDLGLDGRWYYTDEDGYSTEFLNGHPFHALMVAWIDSLPRITRYTTPWTEEDA